MVLVIWKWILHYRWKKTVPKLWDVHLSLLQRVVLAATLFTKYNEPDVSLHICNQFKIVPACYSLHTMLYDLTKSIAEFKETGIITPSSDTGQPEEIRVDQWCTNHGILRYRNISIYEGYQLACVLVHELTTLTKTDLHRSYVERRCKKALTTFILLTELLGYIYYEKKLVK